MYKNSLQNYFFILISFLPISFLIGPAISLSNILLFDISFLILLVCKKKFKFINVTTVILLFFLYAYFIFNTFNSLNINLSFNRNFGFIRLIIFFIGINYFFYDRKFQKIFFFWFLIIILVIFDIIFERYTGSNIIGYNSIGNRIVSFFKDEAIPGGFIHSFTFLLAGYILMNNNKKFKKYSFLIALSFILIAFFSVILTGERSNSIKFILSLIIFFILFDKISFKIKIILFIGFIFTFYLAVTNNDFLKNRMFYSIQYSAKTFNSSFIHGKPWDNPSGNLYAKLYRSGYDVFRNYPYFGVGNKNYRIESCQNKQYILNIHKLTNDYVCMTHPHQIYFELLSEHGLLGTIIILSIYFFLIFKVIKKVLLEKNYIGIGCLAYLIPVFTPILPSGSFFSDYNSTLFFINLSMLYATSKNINIFKKNKNEYQFS